MSARARTLIESRTLGIRPDAREDRRAHRMHPVLMTTMEVR